MTSVGTVMRPRSAVRSHRASRPLAPSSLGVLRAQGLSEDRVGPLQLDQSLRVPAQLEEDVPQVVERLSVVDVLLSQGLGQDLAPLLSRPQSETRQAGAAQDAGVGHQKEGVLRMGVPQGLRAGAQDLRHELAGSL